LPLFSRAVRPTLRVERTEAAGERLVDQRKVMKKMGGAEQDEVESSFPPHPVQQRQLGSSTLGHVLHLFSRAHG